MLVALALSNGALSVQAEERWLEPAAASPYAAFMKQGDALSESASKHWPRETRRAIVLTSLATDAYLKAVESDPTQGDPHYRIAALTHAYLTYHNNSSPAHLLRREIEHYNLFEKKSPLDSRLESVWFRRAIARTKLGGKASLSAGVDDYDHHLATIDVSSSLRQRTAALTHGNRAELLMMLGRLPEAIAGYEQALAFNDSSSTGYGLAVALDRDGQNTRARQVAGLYARGDVGNSLLQPNIFFVPSGEVYYYIAIRAEGLGSSRMAVIAYRKFLELVPNSMYADKARANIRMLGGEINLWPKTPRTPRTPRRRGRQ